MSDDIIDFPLTQFRDVQRRCYETAKQHGWWEKYDCPEADMFKEEIMSSKLMLMVSELSETLEEIRNGAPPALVYFSGKGEGSSFSGNFAEVQKLMIESKNAGRPKPEGIPIELADAVIRIFDLAERHKVDLADAIRLKMEYNEGREYKHGGKAL